MEHRTFDYLNSRQLPTGRRIFALKAMRRVAEGLGEAAIVARCDRAIAADEACLRMEMTYRQGKSFATTARGGAAEFDREIDAVWAGVHAVAQGQRIVEDVNPETGEPLAEPEAEPIAEADAPAPAAADPIT